jgi:hypothetical protein
MIALGVGIPAKAQRRQGSKTTNGLIKDFHRDPRTSRLCGFAGNNPSFGCRFPARQFVVNQEWSNHATSTDYRLRGL